MRYTSKILSLPVNLLLKILLGRLLLLGFILVNKIIFHQHLSSLLEQTLILGLIHQEISENISIILLFLRLRVFSQGLPEVVLAEGEEVAVAHAPHAGRPPVARRAHVEDADLAEVGACLESGQHCPALVVDNLVPGVNVRT